MVPVHHHLVIAALLVAVGAIGCEPTSRHQQPLRQQHFALDAGDDVPPNTPPVAADDTFEVDEDETTTFDVLANDIDDDADTLTVYVSNSTDEGVLEDLGLGQFRYTPRSNFYGSDSFTYGVLDGNGGSAEAVVTLVVVGVNDPPRFVSPTPPAGALIDAVVGRPLQVTLLASDIDGDVVTLRLDPIGASTMPTIEGSSLRWLPVAADAGNHSVTVTASDGAAEDSRQFSVSVSPGADTPCGQTVCVGGKVCFDGTCLDPCIASADCASGALCFDGHCATDACEYRDCDAPQSCALGGCFRECTFDGECRPGQRCFGTRCAETSCQDIVCPVGATCVGGACRAACEDDAECSDGSCFDGGCALNACQDVICPAGQQCDTGSCVPEPDTPADEPLNGADGCGCETSDPLPAATFALFVVLALAVRRAHRTRR